MSFESSVQKAGGYKLCRSLSKRIVVSDTIQQTTQKKLKLDNIYLPKRKIESFIVSIVRDWGRLRTIEVKKHSKIVQV